MAVGYDGYPSLSGAAFASPRGAASKRSGGGYRP